MSETSTLTPPTAAPPAQSPGEKAPADFMSDIVGELQEMDSAPPPPPEKKAKSADAPSKPPKPTEKPAAKPQTTSPEEGAESATPAPETGGEVKPVKAAELRTAYESLRKRFKEEYEPEIQRLRTKVKDFESKTGEEASSITTQMQALRERNAELEKKIAFYDYTEDQTFKKQYAEPYRRAWAEALSDFRELEIRERTGEDDMGEPVYRTRPADEKDLLRLANMKLSEMDAKAQEMFGASSARAINHIQNIRRLSDAQRKAIEEAKKSAAEWKTQRDQENQIRGQALSKTWTDINKSLEERFPKAFKVDEADPEDKVSHSKGFALADLLFLGNDALTPEQIENLPASFRDTLKAKQPLSDTQKVQLHAIARIKMANHDRKVMQLKKANARIKELEKTIADYEQSEPDASKAGRTSPAGGSKDWLEQAEDELRALDK